MLKRTAAYGDFKRCLSFDTSKFNILHACFRYMLKLIDPIYTKLGFNAQPEDTHLDIKLRKKAVRFFIFDLLKINCKNTIKTM